MSNRSEYTQQVIVDGKVYNITAVDHSTIDDVIIAESIIYAVGKIHNSIDDTRRVDLSIRNYFIKLGVEL